MKTFFDEIFINTEELKSEGIEYPIKLEYFKTINTEEDVEAKYGIEIVKTDYIDGKVKVNSNIIKDITKYQDEIEKILNIFRNNKVTPFGMQDVLIDIYTRI